LFETIDMETQRAMVAGIRMRWEEAGPANGTPVVLVHGLPTSPALWRYVVPLIEGARCLAWEMVGYGDSIPEGHQLDLSVAAQASYLRSWMKELEISGAVLVGHDLGGGVAQIAATRDYASVGLVLIDSVAYDGWPIAPVKAIRGMGGPFLRLPNRAVRRFFGRLIRKGHDDRARARESADLHWGPYGERDAAEVLMRQLRWLRNRDTNDLGSALSGLGLPARVVWGSKDPYLKPALGERLAGDLGTDLRRVPGARHFVPEDNPDVVAAAVSEVLGELGPA
jgi:pimeloyl-ACP methyl ester carboxylesterase